MARRYFGFLTGDDVEILAEAFRVAVGFKYRAWDIRCLFVPDLLVAPFVWLGARLGITDVRTLVVFATVPEILATAMSTLLVHTLAMHWTGDRRVARAAALLFALHWIPLGFASTAYPRTIATTAILAAVYVLAVWQRAPWIAGLLCALAFADRFSEALFLIPLLILARRRALWVVLGFVAGVLVMCGFYDYVTWGEWFGSVRKFAALTLVQSDFASRIKHQSPLWYLFNLPRWLSPLLLPFLWYARRHVLNVFVLIPLAALSIIQHKELRYLEALIPLAMLLAAIGFGVMRQRRVAVGLLVLGIVWNLHGLRFLAAKTMPAVEAAQMLGRDPAVNNVVMSQLWAYGDRLYFTDRMGVLDIGTPPRDLANAIRIADAVCLYASDLTPETIATLQRGGFVKTNTFRESRARDVVVFRRTGRDGRAPGEPLNKSDTARCVRRRCRTRADATQAMRDIAEERRRSGRPGVARNPKG